MNRADRGPLLLIVAGVLLLLPIVAYSIHDVEDRSRRMEEVLEHRTFEAQARRSIGEMRALRDESDPTRPQRDGGCEEHEGILRSLKRIEELLEALPPTRPGC